MKQIFNRNILRHAQDENIIFLHSIAQELGANRSENGRSNLNWKINKIPHPEHVKGYSELFFYIITTVSEEVY